MAWWGHVVGGGSCEAALMGHCGVAWPSDMVAESMLMRVGDV